MEWKRYFSQSPKIFFSITPADVFKSLQRLRLKFVNCCKFEF